MREELSAGKERIVAIQDSIERTGLSLVEAACTTIAGLSSVYFVDIPALQHFGSVIIIMTASSLVAAVFILPVFFGIRRMK